MSWEISDFQTTVWDYYASHGRDLPWRKIEPDGRYDAYKILVSETMLQQTQVNRVIPKYQSFLSRFPDVESLAEAPLGAVLTAWSGLGYNRRAKFLHEAAHQLKSKVGQWTLEDLTACKGIGANTAAAVLTYAYNQPNIFIETNIRTVFIHHFFQGKTGVTDKEILSLVEQALPVKEGKGHYREWYWAFMDYGTYLKATVGNVSRASRHYSKQSKFSGSKRQVRGQVLRLLQNQNHSASDLASQITDERLKDILEDLVGEGLVTQLGGTYRLG